MNSTEERIAIINALWQEGRTIGEINEQFHLIYILPEHLKSVNKDTRLDFSRRLPWNDVKISRLALSGFYLVYNGVESKHRFIYTSFKHLLIK